jgi:DNA-binding response OmpR family regulator
MDISNYTILIAEDEEDISKFLYKGLTEENYQCICVNNGQDVIEQLGKHKVDLILLDWMMPKLTGIEVCKALRKSGNKTPIIFLTAKDTVEDTIEGLKSGANDYIKKPFDFEELLARIQTHLRLFYKIDDVLQLGDIEINRSKHTVKRDGKLINLTDKEYNFLAHLIYNKGMVCSRQSIIQEVWDIYFDYDTSLLDVYMNAIRKKLNLEKNELIKTVRGVGFLAEDQ